MELEVFIAYLMMGLLIPTTYISYRFFQSKSKISANWLSLAVFVVGVWTFNQGLAIILLNTHPSYSITLLYISRTLGAICAVCIMCFTLEYSTGESVSSPLFLILTLPAVAIHTLFALSPDHFMIITIADGSISYDFNTLGIIHIVYVGILYIMSVGLMLRELLVADGIKFAQARVLFIGLFCGISFSFIPILDFPDVINPTVVGLFITISTFTYGLNRYNLFTTSPVSSNQILEGVTEGLLVVNSEQEIIQANNKVHLLFGRTQITLGDTIDSVFPSEVVTGLVTEGESTIEYDGSKYRVNTKSSTDIASGDGLIISIDDISDIESQRTDLNLLRQVFSRIFRHNIRNRLTVIQGHTQYLHSSVRGTDQELHTETVLSACNDLITKSEKALLINSILQTDGDLYSIEITDFINSGLNKVQIEEDTVDDVEVSIQEPCSIEVHPQAHYIISNAIENAILHTDNSTVSISASEPYEGRVLVEIEDNGDGIPIDEIDVIESGTESQLDHSTGVGLWVMQILASKSGADFSITTSESGSSIQIEFSVD